LELSRSFGWTPNDIDDTDLEMFWDYVIVANVTEKQKNVKQGYIDQIL